MVVWMIETPTAKAESYKKMWVRVPPQQRYFSRGFVSLQKWYEIIINPSFSIKSHTIINCAQDFWNYYHSVGFSRLEKPDSFFPRHLFSPTFVFFSDSNFTDILYPPTTIYPAFSTPATIYPTPFFPESYYPRHCVCQSEYVRVLKAVRKAVALYRINACIPAKIMADLELAILNECVRDSLSYCANRRMFLPPRPVCIPPNWSHRSSAEVQRTGRRYGSKLQSHVDGPCIRAKCWLHDHSPDEMDQLFQYCDRCYLRGVPARGRGRAVWPRYEPNTWNQCNAVIANSHRTNCISEGSSMTLKKDKVTCKCVSWSWV